MTLNRLRQLGAAGSAPIVATDALEPFYSLFCVHSLYKGSYGLQVAVTAALEAHAAQFAVNNVKSDKLAASPLGFEFIHTLRITYLENNFCPVTIYAKNVCSNPYLRGVSGKSPAR
jgi:hypothetical protein